MIAEKVFLMAGLIAVTGGITACGTSGTHLHHANASETPEMAFLQQCRATSSIKNPEAIDYFCHCMLYKASSGSMPVPSKEYCVRRTVEKYYDY